MITETLKYSNLKTLRIIGANQVIDGSELDKNAHIFTTNSGADLSISNLSFVDSYSKINSEPLSPVSGKGTFVTVADESNGVIQVQLDTVSITHVSNHGVHCTLGDDCYNGNDRAGNGSKASISVTVKNMLINRVGFRKADADGIRVDGRGAGDIYFSATNSTFINIGADGVELDEGNNGNVIIEVSNSLFVNNGEYCNLIPDKSVKNGPCDDNGDPDVVDVDKAGKRALSGKVSNVIVSNNFDEGVKISEENTSSVHVYLESITMINNNDQKEGIEIEEQDSGDIKPASTIQI